MKHIFCFLFLLFASSANAATCEDLGLYALTLYGCPYYNPQVITTIPLCQQEEWRHLSFLDDRCYQELLIDSNCTQWDCPAPYDKIMREPISGKNKTFRGSRELVDWNYRACRQGLADAMEKLRRKKR